MKQFFIRVLQSLLNKLDQGVVFPTQRLNYKKCIEAIKGQTPTGRKSFYAILVSRISEEDKNYILDILTHANKETPRTNKRVNRIVRVS